MGSFSLYTQNKILNTIFSGDTFTTPTKYVALFKSDAGLESNNPSLWQEVNGTAYARPAAANTSFSVAAASSVTLTSPVSFAVAGNVWGTVTHAAIIDAATGGNVIAWGALVSPSDSSLAPRTILEGDQFILRSEYTTFSIID